MNMNSIVEWLAGRTESRNCIVLTRDSALNQDTVILSKNTGEIIDMLVDTMRENPRLAFIIKEAYLTNKQYAQTNSPSLKRRRYRDTKPENVVRYYSTWRRPDIIIQLLKVPQPPADIPLANGKKLN